MIETRSEHIRWHDIDALMQQGLAATFPAAVLLVRQKGKTLFHRAYGWIDPEQQQIPVRETTLFDLASLTKLFTAAAFMTLVGTGQTSLEMPVSHIIPEFGGIRPLQQAIDPHTKTPLPIDPKSVGKKINANEVTFWHLLTHTSGLAAWEDLCRRDKSADIPPMPQRVPLAMRRHRLEAFLHSPRFVSPPGEHFLYSDLGFILLGEAIEGLADSSLPEYLSRAIVRPLGIESMTYTPLGHGIPHNQIAPTEFCPWRERRIWGEVHDENASCLGGVAGHAGLFATAEEIAVFGQCFLAGECPILSSDLIKMMIREQVWEGDERRGLGWKLQTPDNSPVGRALGPRSFGHTGFTGTSLWIDPDRELIVVLLTNRVYYGREGEAITRFRIRLHDAVVAVVDHFPEAVQ